MRNLGALDAIKSLLLHSMFRDVVTSWLYITFKVICLYNHSVKKFSRNASFFLDQFLHNTLQGITQVEILIEEKEKIKTLMRLSDPKGGGSVS